MSEFILFNIYFCFLIVAIPIFMQLTAHQSIDERKFKKYKIKKIGFLFKGMQGESASTHGVILPMLIIQIQGYALCILTLLFVIVNEIFNFVEVEKSTGIVIIVLLIHVSISTLISITAGIISKKRK